VVNDEYRPDWGAIWGAVGGFVTAALTALGVFLPKVWRSRSDTNARDTDTRLKADRARLKLDQDKHDHAAQGWRDLYQEMHVKVNDLLKSERDCQVRLATVTTLLEEVKKDLEDKDRQMGAMKERLLKLEKNFDSDEFKGKK
jgi:hypothetical protein